MKKSISFILAILLSASVIAQNNSKEYYQEKAKKQKNAAWKLLGGGAATSLIGFSQFNFAGSDNGEVNNTTATILFLQVLQLL